MDAVTALAEDGQHQPGKPAPAPRSAQAQRLGRELQQLGAVPGMAAPELGQGRRARPGSSRSFQLGQQRRGTRSRSAIWAGVAPLTAAKPAASIDGRVRPQARGAAADMGQQGGERAGGDAFDARGLAEGQRAARRRASRAPRWRGRRPRRSRGRRAGAGPRRGGRRPRRRPGGRGSRRRRRRSRPARAPPAPRRRSRGQMRGQVVEADRRDRPAAAVRLRRWPSALTGKPAVPACGGRQRQRGRARRARSASAAALAREGLRARSEPTHAQRHARGGQPLVGVVGAQGQAELGPAGEHPIGLGDAAGDQVVDHHADVGLVAGEGGRRRRPAAARAAFRPATSPWAPASS